MLSDAINRPPAWTFDPEDPNSHPGLVINTIVSAIVTTEFGLACFLNPKVNAVFWTPGTAILRNRLQTALLQQMAGCQTTP